MVQQLIAVAGLVTLMLGAITGLVKAVIWVWNQLRKAGRLADDLTGEPARPGLPEGRPGILERITDIEGHLAHAIPRLDSLDARLTAVEARLGTTTDPTT